MATLAFAFAFAGCGGPHADDSAACRGTAPNDVPVDCRFYDMPRLHDQPHGAKLSLYVHHVPALHQRKGQLWMLAGGPGQPGTSWLDDRIAGLRELLPDYDFYIPDHRGVGQSELLSCPMTESGQIRDLAAYWTDCAREVEAAGKHLDEFTATEAARDLEMLIEHERRGDEPVLVWGVSYGSYLAHRYLQIAPAQASGVVLESLCLGNCAHAGDKAVDQAAQRLFALCGADPFCSGKLGADPWQTLVDLGQTLDYKACAAAPSHEAFRELLATVATTPRFATWLPMLVYRVKRCNRDDVEALGLLSRAIALPSGWSAVLGASIVLSEIAPPPPPVDMALADQAGLEVTNATELYYAKVQPVWPVYPRDRFVGQWAQTATPLLLMSGSDDENTPDADMDLDAMHFSAPHQQHVIVPYAGHSPSGHDACARAITTSFLRAPATPLDTSCVAAESPPDFHFDRALVQRVLGTDDAWDGKPVDPAAACYGSIDACPTAK